MFGMKNRPNSALWGFITWQGKTYEISMIEHELVLGNVDSPFLGEIAT
jgi:hypothetical protein